MEQNTALPVAPQIRVTKGNPSDEELAVVTALLAAMGNAPAAEPETVELKKRVARIRRRRALTPRLGWTIGRR